MDDSVEWGEVPAENGARPNQETRTIQSETMPSSMFFSERNDAHLKRLKCGQGLRVTHGWNTP